MSDDFEATKMTDAVQELRNNFTSTDKFSKHLLKTIEAQIIIQQAIKKIAKETCIETIKEQKAQQEIKKIAKETCIETIKEQKALSFDRTVKPALFIFIGCFITFLFDVAKHFLF